ncbi:MAG: TatD family deoxyribonuclease [Bacteroidia bacterium]|nr:TatD family deoxyribonuclease [Bacteroidia bacterium]HRG03793.1 TatD family hydrolase [Paludibacteraceae bacterium]
MIDTHSHIYSEEFDADRDEVILRAQHAGVTKIILPNVDSDSLPRLLKLEARYPDYCYAAVGLHPESVKENYQKELDVIREELERRRYIAVGEIGIDLYWDKTYQTEQILAFQTQVEWAIEFNLPVIIHVRNSHNETIQALKPYAGKGLKGIFHCFGGTPEEAAEIFSLGDFKLGIGGVVTFKNSGLAASLMHIPPENLVLETDSPYLTPAPFRGKRNESAYTVLVAEKLAQVYDMSVGEIDRITTENACSVFSGLK